MKRTLMIGGLLSGLVTVGLSSANAQWGGGVFVDTNNNKAATVGESHARGIADITSSRAWANKTNSEAAINMTEVRSRELDNRQKTADTYFSMRNMNREQRFGTPEEKAAHRAHNQELYYRHAQAGDPKRPSAQQLDPITGTIKWPFALMPDMFEPYREDMATLFGQRAKNGNVVTYDSYEEIKKVGDEMLATLKTNIKKMDPQDWLSGKKFVNQLVYEARHGNG